MGTAILFHALHNLLKASSSPYFVLISTASVSIGRLTMTMPMYMDVYGSSKAALNYIT